MALEIHPKVVNYAETRTRMVNQDGLNDFLLDKYAYIMRIDLPRGQSVEQYLEVISRRNRQRAANIDGFYGRDQLDRQRILTDSRPGRVRT